MSKVVSLLFTACLFGSPVEDARKILTEAAHSKEGDERREAALALSLVPAKDPAAALLEEMLSDKDYQVRVAAIDTLGELNDKAQVKLLRAALGDDTPEVAFAAAKALFAVKDPAGVEALSSVYAGDMKAKSNFFKKEMMDNWRRLKTPRSAFFFAVQRGIGFVPLPGFGAGYSALAGMLADTDFSARAVSLLIVCSEPRGKTCSNLLATSFEDEDWTVRAAAVHIATTTNLAALRPKVEILMADKKAKVRLRAAAGYLRMQTNRPVKAAARPLVKKS